MLVFGDVPRNDPCSSSAIDYRISIYNLHIYKSTNYTVYNSLQHCKSTNTNLRVYNTILLKLYVYTSQVHERFTSLWMRVKRIRTILLLGEGELDLVTASTWVAVIPIIFIIFNRLLLDSDFVPSIGCYYICHYLQIVELQTPTSKLLDLLTSLFISSVATVTLHQYRITCRL
jgi:hypothetical protein